MSQTTTYKTLRKGRPGWSDGTSGGGYVQPDPNYQPARTPDGQPDIQGVWSAGTTTGSQSVEAMPGDGGFYFRKTGTMVVDPPDGKIPYKPWARAKVADLYAHYIDPLATCVPAGMPRQMYYVNLQFIQPPGELLIITEHLQNFRHIPLDGRPHIANKMKLWAADSRGRWEGNTLVIDVTNSNDEAWYDVVGTFHSDSQHVTERLTPIDPNTIQYEATIEDPAVFESPWKIAFPLLRSGNKNYEVFEENCAEGNKSIDAELNLGFKLFMGIEGAH